MGFVCEIFLFNGANAVFIGSHGNGFSVSVAPGKRISLDGIFLRNGIPIFVIGGIRACEADYSVLKLIGVYYGVLHSDAVGIAVIENNAVARADFLLCRAQLRLGAVDTVKPAVPALEGFFAFAVYCADIGAERTVCNRYGQRGAVLVRLHEYVKHG